MVTKSKTGKAKQLRMAPAERHKQLLEAGYAMALEKGLGAVNRVQLGRACGVTDGLVSRYFGNAAGMHQAIMREAIRHGAGQGNVEVLADAMEMEILTEADRKTIGPQTMVLVRVEVERRLNAAA